ncbi:hypothetical protein ES703_12801 [subsurface metagenome]
MSMGETIGLKNLQQALARWTGQNMDVGVATGGTNTTADDTLKNWPVNKWAGGQARIIKANGQEYDRAIASNTATQLTIAGLPGAIVVAAGDIYSIKTSFGVTDITDRWARLLGQVDLARVLGAALAHVNPLIARLTDGAGFDITMATLRDAITAAAPNAKTLNDLFARVTPLEKAAEHNTAELATTDILAAALTPTNTPCLFRVMCAFDTAGVFTATITRGGNTQLVHFNGGANLTVDCLYIFDHLVHSGDTINYQYSVGAQLMVLRVQEIVAGVQ